MAAPAAGIDVRQLQPASLDLRLGTTAYRIRSSFLPGHETVAEKLAYLTMYELPLEPSAILERGHVYLIPLLEELALPEHVYAKANPKSSTGRLDVFTRVITDAHQRFDDIRPGYRGRLFLEIFPRSFTIKVCSGLSLNQLRLFTGSGELDDGGLLRL
ncbi:MAG: 2'-deoxycytidine 5'-triphosphate deaminase, partial [Candidatus Tectomicrobia bacterium]|nr:2'-deoxycytidine 5'-triphosphate deaminase [Candidatus Tectomicrobia bacterium]